MPSRGERVDDRGAGDGVAGAAQGVVALLVGGDEEDLACPWRVRSVCREGAGSVWFESSGALGSGSVSGARVGGVRRSRSPPRPGLRPCPPGGSGPRRRWWCGPGPPAPGTIVAEDGRSAPAVMGSRSLKAHRKGLSNSASTSQARRLASAAGSSGRVRHEQGELPGAFFVATRRGTGRRRRRSPRAGTSVTHPPPTMRPTGSSGTSWENFCHARKASPMSGVAGGQAGVGRHHPAEAVGVLGHEAQADEAAPVLADERQSWSPSSSNSAARIHSTWRA